MTRFLLALMALGLFGATPQASAACRWFGTQLECDLGESQVLIGTQKMAEAASVAEFVERYALGASPAVHDLARDGVARVSVAADETTVPPEVAAVFAETVSLFALHLYVNSAGLRYVPLAAPREVPTRGASRRR